MLISGNFNLGNGFQKWICQTLLQFRLREKLPQKFRKIRCLLFAPSCQANLVDKYKENVKGKIRQFSNYLGQKTWFTGGEVNLSSI